MKTQLLVFVLVAVLDLARGADGVRIDVNTIPVGVQFANYAEARMDGLVLNEGMTADFGASLAQNIEELRAVAQQHGGDLVVLISRSGGISVPLSNIQGSVVLRERDPILTAIFFKGGAKKRPSESERRIRFDPDGGADTTGEELTYTITQEVNTAGATLAFWTYMNLPRFVDDAVKWNLDTIAFESTTDSNFEEVWLPGCDSALRLSKTKPTLAVHIYKGKAAQRS